jgi:hypothetical protein
MRAVNELVIRGDGRKLSAWLARVEASLHDGWKRERRAEERLQGSLAADTRCFSCLAGPDRPAAVVWVCSQGANELSVSNIVPLEKWTLSDEEHNHILSEFATQVLEPIARGTGIEVRVVPYRRGLARFLSAEAIRRLKTFSGAAASKTCLDPNDRGRWQAFVVQTHLDEVLLEPTALEDWLRSEGWPREQRRQLLCEYESGRSLLADYDEERRRSSRRSQK